MPITGQGWELHIQRHTEQTRGNRTRTVGTYQVFHDGAPATGTITVDGAAVPLSGTTAESKGPGQNQNPATTTANATRIKEGRYPLMTSGGPTYVTRGFRSDNTPQAKMPGIELRKTENRTDIIIHPGKNEFLSSIGCINPCTSLPNKDENITYVGSRRRLIALIKDMRAFLDAFPNAGDTPIVNAHVVIDGEPVGAQAAGPAASGAVGVAVAAAVAAAPANATIDGRAVAAANGVDIKNNNVKISTLHPKMEAAIVAVAKVAKAMNLPKPVITSGNDSSHKQGSLHFRNRALDFRGNNITIPQGRTLAQKVAGIVGGDYDVIFETFANKSNNHLHVEFDPD